MRYAPRAAAAFGARWFPDGATVAALSRAPVVLFDRDDTIADRYLRRRARRPLHPPRHYIPESGPYFQAVRLGLGWGMIPDLQLARDTGADLVDLDPAGAMDVELYWQQWRVAGPTLERVARAVQATAARLLH
jgi:LysR family transcriptional regulator (chromosome initiation inhibitor)